MEVRTMTDRVTIRRAVRDYLNRNPHATYRTVVDAVAAELSVDSAEIETEMDKLEKNGFVYLYESDDGTEVKVP